jgi:hypothetical protein
MSKMKKWLLKSLANKYAGAITSYGVGAAVSAILSYVASGPEWVGKALTAILSATSEGEITEINAMTLTVVLTPLVASAVQAGIGFLQSANIEKIQENNGAVVDGLAGPDTVEAAKK